MIQLISEPLTKYLDLFQKIPLLIFLYSNSLFIIFLMCLITFYSYTDCFDIEDQNGIINYSYLEFIHPDDLQNVITIFTRSRFHSYCQKLKINNTSY